MTSPSLDMPTIGQRLKAARQARGLSIDEVAHATRIRVHYLLALEEGDFSALPSAVQGRGFLRSYASYLGVIIQPDAQPGDASVPMANPGANADSAGPPLPAPTSDETAPQSQPRSFFKRRPAKETPAPEAAQGGEATTSQAIFQHIGQTLSQRRQVLGISLDDIAQYTHVRQNYLKALESGAIDSLPSPVQGRGMLSNYAAFLNLDVDSLLLRYADGLQLRRIERLGPDSLHHAETRQTAYPALRRIISLDLVVGILLVVILAVFMIWSISQVATAQEKSTNFSTIPAVAEVLALTATPSVTPTLNTTAQALTPSSQVTATAMPLSHATPVFTVLPSSQAAIQVYVVARQQAWLRVTVDDKVVFTGRILPGNAYPFAGTRQIELLTGSAAALQVFYNQTDLGSLGLVGQVVDLIFTTQGLVLPTSTPLPTTTKTVPITPTPLSSGTPGTAQPIRITTPTVSPTK